MDGVDFDQKENVMHGLLNSQLTIKGGKKIKANLRGTPGTINLICFLGGFEIKHLIFYLYNILYYYFISLLEQ